MCRPHPCAGAVAARVLLQEPAEPNEVSLLSDAGLCTAGELQVCHIGGRSTFFSVQYWLPLRHDRHE
jgi:hypothetical protein